ncbi:DNA cytosine methyltransferase [Streptomyces sp. MNU103]|uniref:DNA cytosine methyltransferase n=1 Tax=Streptomyces sp. MNU103 TaxID=2560024 RepID=UPI003FD1002B
MVRSFRAYNNGLLHPDENRFVGLRELTRLQSFPDEYDWGDSTVEEAWARVGNSVPPLFMRAVATTIREHLLTPTPPPPDPSRPV